MAICSPRLDTTQRVMHFILPVIPLLCILVASCYTCMTGWTLFSLDTVTHVCLQWNDVHLRVF